MKIELINTGSELLLGRVLNTNQQWLCRQLADRGLPVWRQVSVPDTAEAIQEAVREALGRARLVITTGGLGPTSDDRTRDFVASLLGLKLVMDETVRQWIKSFFAQRRRPQPPLTEVQALVPEGAKVLRNVVGTAPGLLCQVSPGRCNTEQAWLLMLPGPPKELQPMFANEFLPLLDSIVPPGTVPFTSRTLHTTGIGESVVEERIAEPLAELISKGLEIGYCARVGEVDVRLAIGAAGSLPLLQAAERIVRETLREAVFGVEEETLESVVIRELTERKMTLAVAESCTGGLLAHRLTNVPGSSAAFVGGIVAYSNAVKIEGLGVREQTLNAHGAVSEAVAREMAEGARRAMRADYAMATTGIAGPSGGTPEKPVGTVFIALAGPKGIKVLNPLNAFGREIFKNVTTQQALDLLRRTLLKP